MADADLIADQDAIAAEMSLVRTKLNRALPPHFQAILLNQANAVWNQHAGPRPNYNGLHLKQVNGQLWSVYQGQVDMGPAHEIYAFVTMPDGEIRVAPRAGGLHHELSGRCLHVRYAGEAEFVQGDLGRWNNVSGTYRAPPTLKYQAGFRVAAGFTEAPIA
ncbi:MAG TPA: hypothetical protein VF584_12780 [Longimicrobium sp.]|jgi:hypothetical protein